uniref:Eukaryotic translation initiation factor 3 subunit p66 n=1 Tax=Parascaris univalens TaxID=6257 RepID=A0A914ZWL8_PARUN
MSSDGESAQLRHDIQVEKAKIRNEKNRLRLLLSQGRQNLDVAEGADNRAPCGSVGSVEHSQDQPHQQANKCDRIGKVADWIGVNQFGDRNRRNDRYSNHYSSGAGGSEYDYVHDDDESTFQLVDTTKPHRSMIQRSARTRQQHFVYRKIIQKEEERRKQATCEQNQKIKRIIAKLVILIQTVDNAAFNLFAKGEDCE